MASGNNAADRAARQALIAQRLHARSQNEQEMDAIPRRDGRGAAPLSSAQKRLWVASQLEPDNPTSNRPLAVRLRGHLDQQVLTRSLTEIVRRHEALRTVFAKRHGTAIQLVRPPRPLDLNVRDLRSLPLQSREPEARRICASLSHDIFDLQEGPLIRATLLQLAEQDHILLLSMHHIIFDGWSASVLLRELTACYEAFRRGTSPSLPDLPIQYADYAGWQQGRLDTDPVQQQLLYWVKHLEGMPSGLALPADYSPSRDAFSGAQYAFTLPETLTERLKTLSRHERVTLFMTLLAAFQVLLGRYAQQSDVVVGTPIAGRSHLETEQMIGCFMNVLVLRTDLSGRPTFRALLGRVREVTLQAYKHQEVPFEEVVNAVRPEREIGTWPLFRVMFNFRNHPHLEHAQAGDLHLSPFRFDSGVSQGLPLSLEITDGPRRLQGLFTYAREQFRAATVERMAGHLRTLLEAIATNPDHPIAAHPLLTSAERHQVLADRSDTATDYPRNRCIHELFEIQAARTPDAVAVAFEDQSVTYRELNYRANQLARHLQKHGVGPETLVGLCVERSLAMVVGLLGILKAGGAYVPLDPSYPRERRAFMLHDTQAPILLTQRSLRADLPDHKVRVIALDADGETIAQERRSNVNSGVTAHDLAYVMYTSGSTGRPKGVAIEHRSVTNLLWSMRRKPGLDTSDVLLSVTTLSFDISIPEVFLPLTTGAQVVVVSRDVAADGFRLAEALEHHNVSLLQATPATWRLLLDAGWNGTPGLKAICGGEALTPILAKALLERDVELWNLYGPTEATVWSTACRIENAADIMIGRPVANTTAYVFDEQMNLVPVGVPGELYVGGHGLARGYLNRPDLTAAHFIPDPFSETPGGRLYKTGDRVRWSADGQLEFLGRLDRQVKIRGFRIELGEVEAVLAEHEAVHQAVVVARDDSTTDERLVAYIVTADPPTQRALCRFLQQKLPDYMVPSVFVVLDALPLLPNGKINREALPPPDPTTQLESEIKHTAPRTPTEQLVSSIWAEVLGVERIGIHDDFFALGGHSLLAMQVISRLCEHTGEDVPLHLVFTAPTVAELAHAITHITPE